MKKKSFVAAFFKVSIDHLFDNLEPRERNYCFRKKSGKILDFFTQKFVRTLALGAGFMYFLQILIGSLNCLRL